MVKQVKKKLKSYRGETIAEVLIALLISSIALVMLASMISATVNLVTKSKEKMKDYYKANSVLETMELTTAEGEDPIASIEELKITITGKESGESAESNLSIDLSEGELTCYKNTQLGKPVYSYTLN